MEEEFRGEKQVQEQRQALLRDDDLSDSASELAIPPRDHHKTRRRRTALFCALLTAITTLLILSVVVRGTRQHQNSTSHPYHSAVFQDDYILSPDWDYLASPQVREYEWTLEETEFNPDGVYRPMLLINHQFPGPLIEINEGDTVRVRVNNRLSNATSIHWHGIFQNGTNFMDGTVGVTQCPIAPETTFTYEFTVTGQSGTYWYHAHHSTQASDGLVGPFIVHGKDERVLQQVAYDTDRIVMLSDHYHRLTSGLVRQYLAPDMENTEPTPDGALINGRAVRDCDRIPSTRRCDNSTTSHPMFLFDRMPHQTHHRLRVINTGAFAEFQFSIDEHDLVVTEVDGTDVLPSAASSFHRLNIAPGQRYSVIMSAKDSSSGTESERDRFRVRARMVDACFTALNDHAVTEVAAVVAYHTQRERAASTSTILLPESRDWSDRLDVECRDMNTTALVPVVPVAAPATEDAFFYFRLNFRIGAHRLSRAFFNESTFHPNVTSPTLFRVLEGEDDRYHRRQPAYVVDDDDENADPSSPPKPLTIVSPGTQTLDLLFHNLDDGAHPIHIHGHKFFILARGRGYPTPRTSLVDGISRTTLSPLYDSPTFQSALVSPLRRDTVTVEADGWTLVRVVADNPGVWAVHCHVAWHAEAGMAMQIVARPDELVGKETGRKGMKIPEENRRLCHDVDRTELQRGTTPVDTVYYDENGEGDQRNGVGCEGASARLCGYGD